MEPTDLTIRLLSEMRDEMRGMREDQRLVQREIRDLGQRSDARFEVIETTLRDLAQQMVMLGRAVKVAIEHRPEVDRRLEALEQRVEVIERRP